MKIHLLHLVGILFPHIIEDARSKPHTICYEFYFGCKVRDKNKSWTPLRYVVKSEWGFSHDGWIFRGKCRSPFPWFWREPNNHSSDSYLCVNYFTGINSKSKHTVKCPRFAIYNKACPTDWRVACNKTSGKSFSDKISDSHEDQGRASRGQCWLRSTLEASWFLFETLLLT
jgi:hypothetical protein